MIVLDTNIVIYFLNGHKEVARQLSDYSPREVAVSFITLGELSFGAYHSKRSEHNLQKIFELAETIEVIHSNEDLAKVYGRLKHQAIQMGRFPGDHDLWIAATALQQQASLITQNEKHFRWIPDLESINWVG